MKLRDAEKMANELMYEHLPATPEGPTAGWTFRFDRAVSRLGQARVRGRNSKIDFNAVKTISLSRAITEMNDERIIRDTLLHEIAHAIDFENHGHFTGHGTAWKYQARKIGANPKACNSNENLQTPKGRWLGTCPSGHVQRKFRRPRAVRSCGKCAPYFTRDYLITWTQMSKFNLTREKLAAQRISK